MQGTQQNMKDAKNQDQRKGGQNKKHQERTKSPKDGSGVQYKKVRTSEDMTSEK